MPSQPPVPFPPPRIADEDDLCRLWATGDLPREALLTTAGDALQVVYPGRRTGTGGPDFQGAMLVDEAGHLHVGDVELHLRSRDWIAHGHRADPAYDGVVLHVVLEDDGSPCLRSNALPVPVLALASWIVAPLAIVADHTDIAPVQPCRVAPRLSTERVRVIVQEAGRERLRGKAAALEAQISVVGPEQALFAAVLDAAGYSRNREPCALLAERVPVERLFDLLAGKRPPQARDIATAVLLGLAGLLAPNMPAPWHALWARYADLWPLPPLRSDRWVRGGVRPANRPESRLRGVAALLARHGREGLAASLLAPLRAGDADGLLAALEAPADGEGQPLPPTHADLSLGSAEPTAQPALPAVGEGRGGQGSQDTGEGLGVRPAGTALVRQAVGTPLIGRTRAIEMAVNVVVPFALAVRGTPEYDLDGSLEAGAWRTVGLLPAGEDTDPSRQMRTLLAGSGHRLRAPGALELQGLLHLYRAHCSVHACWECPLAGHSTMT